MATTNDNGQVEELLRKEQELINQKRELTGNPEWMPAGGEHGAGIIPEHIWKQYNPDSKEDTALDFNNEGGEQDA